MTRDAPSADETKRTTVEQYLTSRRKLLAGTAGIGATMLAGCTGNSGTETPGSDGDEMASETDTEEESMDQPHPDVDILNYALTLEHLEHVFYRDGIKKYGADEFQNADALGAFSEEVRMDVPGQLKTVRDHEKAHVDAITSVVNDLGSTPVGEAEYTFGHETPTEFLQIAKALENTGVAAYKGAAPDVKTDAVLTSALAVHSVEARHASLLNFLNSSSPFPKAFGEAKSMDEVVEIAAQFIDSEMGGDSMSSSGEEPMAKRKEEDDTSDVNVLNYALTLEHLEHAFYRDGLKQYSDEDIMSADALSGFSSETRQTIPGRLGKIRDHEKAHVDAIVKTVNKLGGTPVEEAEYDFGYTTPSEFLGVAKALENTGVAAYAGAAGTIKNDAVFKAAASIHDVEARHASFLNELNGTSPFPAAFDEAKTMDEVVEIASQFIKSE